MYEILRNREIIKIIGVDSIKFLQNLVTNDICKSKYCYTYLLNNQGRYLFDFFVYVLSLEEIYLDIDKSNKAALIDHLNFYKLRSKIQIIDCSEEYKVIYSHQKLDIYSSALKNCFCKTSEDSHAHLLSIGCACSLLVLHSNSPNHLSIDTLVTARDPRYAKLGFRSISEVGVIPRLDRGIHSNIYEIPWSSHGMTIYLEDKYNFAIIGGVEDLITDKSIPNMYGAEELNAVSFDKGCYVGQEVISRAKYQGVIRRKIYKVTSEEDLSSLVKDEEILAGNEKIGVICSSYRNKAIALIREEKYLACKKSDITVKGIKINLSLAPWY